MTTSLLSLPFLRPDGSTATLGEFGARALLVVNVASKCGLTPQYEGLEKLYERYKEKGLLVIGFPANDFAAQEPGSDEEIQQFCRTNFGVKFPVMKKISVKGEKQHPLYKELSHRALKREGTKMTSFLHTLARFFKPKITELPVLWNFEKFLLDAQGNVLARFSPEMIPEDSRIIRAIESALR